MDATALALSIVSGILQILGYVVYNIKVQKGDIKPDAASWGIWAFGSILNMLSYVNMTHDWVKDILPIACSASCVTTVMICLWRKQFGRPDWKGWMIFGMDIVITIVWYFTSAAEASLLYQVGTVLSFVPIVCGIKNGKGKEDWTPWFIWTMAYGMFLISVTLRLNNLVEMAYPITCLVVHCYTAWIVLDYRRPY